MPRAPSSGFLSHDGFSAELVKLLVSVWSASGTYPHDAPVDNRPRPQPHGLRTIPGEAQMDEIVCANTAFRYWRCPPQVRDLYPRLPNSEEGWRALSQAPFVTDVLKTPVITAASTREATYIPRQDGPSDGTAPIQRRSRSTRAWALASQTLFVRYSP